MSNIFPRSSHRMRQSVFFQTLMLFSHLLQEAHTVRSNAGSYTATSQVPSQASKRFWVRATRPSELF